MLMLLSHQAIIRELNRPESLERGNCTVRPCYLTMYVPLVSVGLTSDYQQIHSDPRKLVSHVPLSQIEGVGLLGVGIMRSDCTFTVLFLD